MTDGSRHIWEAQRSALGAFIRTQRELANLSLRQLAETADISNAYLSQVERGIHEPSMRVLHGISEALGVSMKTLLQEAGVSEEPSDACTVEDAIRMDDLLSTEQKRALIGVYRSYTADKD